MGDLDWTGVRKRLSGMTGNPVQTLTPSGTVDPWTAMQAGLGLTTGTAQGLASLMSPLTATPSDALAFTALLGVAQDSNRLTSVASRLAT